MIVITFTRDVGTFYVGGLYYCLRIGKVQAEPGAVGGSPGNATLVFDISAQDWKKLKNGDPIWLTWGCRQPEAYESIKPISYLNKKMLAKK